MRQTWIGFFIFLFELSGAYGLEIEKAFQNEKDYLLSQQQALVSQQRHMEQAYNLKISKNKEQVLKLQKELVRLTSDHDHHQEELLELERKNRDLQKRGLSFESTYKKALKILHESEKALHFEIPNGTEVFQPLDLDHSDLNNKHLQDQFKFIWGRAQEVLQASVRQEVYKGPYLDDQDRLAEGNITRMGRSIAFLQEGDRQWLLGPHGRGVLKVLDQVPRGTFFIFDNIKDLAHFKRPGTWVEKLADLTPVLFLMFILTLVAGLFFVLIRV